MKSFLEARTCNKSNILCAMMPSYGKIDLAGNIILLLKLCRLLNGITFLKSVWELPSAYQYIENTGVEVKLLRGRGRFSIQHRESALWFGTLLLFFNCTLELHHTRCNKVKTPRERHLGRNLAPVWHGICVPLGYCQDSFQ